MSGFLEVGTNGSGDVVINHPKLTTDKHGRGYIIFTPEQAMRLSELLSQKSTQARRERRRTPSVEKESHQQCQFPHKGDAPRASRCVEFKNQSTLERYREHMCGVHARMEHNHITVSVIDVKDCPRGEHHADRLNHEMARYAHNRRRP